MQRYGPPPSYPNLKIPGLNAPIPDGCSFGYHAGGWGKPPVDESGKALYGDVFGQQNRDFQVFLLETTSRILFNLACYFIGCIIFFRVMLQKRRLTAQFGES